MTADSDEVIGSGAESTACWMRLSFWMVQVLTLIMELVSKGKLTPVFFGSALTNFGVETFLEHFLQMTTSPLPRISDEGRD